MVLNSLNSIINDILKVIRGSEIATTEPISKRQIEEWVHQYRALLLKRDLDKGKYPNPDYIQEISHLQLEAVDVVGDEITSLGIPSNYKILRTKLELPTTLDLNFKSGFTYIGSPMGYELQYISEGRSMWQQYRKYTGSDPVVFLRNNRLYVVSGEPIAFITVRGVFEIPPEVGRFINPITSKPLFTYDSKYPIPNEYIPTIKQMILTHELKVEAIAPSDKTNDDEHNLNKQ